MLSLTTRLAAIAGFVLASPFAAHAQDYPSRAITFITRFIDGSG